MVIGAKHDAETRVNVFAIRNFHINYASVQSCACFHKSVEASQVDTCRDTSGLNWLPLGYERNGRGTVRIKQLWLAAARQGKRAPSTSDLPCTSSLLVFMADKDLFE